MHSIHRLAKSSQQFSFSQTNLTQNMLMSKLNYSTYGNTIKLPNENKMRYQGKTHPYQNMAKKVYAESFDTFRNLEKLGISREEKLLFKAQVGNQQSIFPNFNDIVSGLGLNTKEESLENDQKALVNFLNAPQAEHEIIDPEEISHVHVDEPHLEQVCKGTRFLESFHQASLLGEMSSPEESRKWAHKIFENVDSYQPSEKINLLEEALSNDLQSVSFKNNNLAMRRTNLIKQLQEFENLGKTQSREEQGKKFADFIFDGSEGGIARFNCNELRMIANTLWNVGYHELIVQMLLTTEDKSFKNDPENIDFFLSAILKSDFSNIYFVEEAIRIFKDQIPNERFHAMMGKLHAIQKNVYLDLLVEIGEQAKREGKTPEEFDNFEKICSVHPENGNGSRFKADIDFYMKYSGSSTINYQEILDCYSLHLKESAAHYKIAFTDSYDPRLGSRLLHRLLEKGKFEEARDVARVVRDCCLNEGGGFENNPVIIRCYLESLYILNESNEAIESMERRLLDSLKTRSSVENIRIGLSGLRSQDKGITQRIIQLQDRLEELHDKIEKGEDVVSSPSKALDSRTNFLNNSFNYKGAYSNFLGGNLRFGNQLTDHGINAYDINFFEKLLDMPFTKIFPAADLNQLQKITSASSFGEIANEHEFNDVADFFVRFCFKTNELELERLDSPGHKEHDAIANGFIVLAGALDKKTRKEIEDSRTNIANALSFRVGDCRHHAQAKQLLWDRWHTERGKELIGQKMEAFESGDKDRYEELSKRFEEHSKIQLRTMSVEIWSQVQLNSNWQPTWKDGVMVAGSEPQKLEEHTLTGLFEFGDDDACKLTFRDAFYQNTFDFKDKEIDLNRWDPEKNNCPVDTIKVVDSDSQEVRNEPVYISFPHYATNKPGYIKEPATSKSHGLDVPKLDPTEVFSDEHQQRVMEAHRNIAKCHTPDGFQEKQVK